MYIIVNKAKFIVRENPNEYIKNNINSINTTSLSYSKVATHLLISFPIINNILQIVVKNKRTEYKN